MFLQDDTLRIFFLKKIPPIFEDRFPPHFFISHETTVHGFQYLILTFRWTLNAVQQKKSAEGPMPYRYLSRRPS